jgi:carbon-monoxide dehydrogenase small subunit
MLMTTRRLLDDVPDPSETDIREAISGQLCRCTGYENIVAAVRWAAEHPGGAVEADPDAMSQSAPAVDGEAVSDKEVSA